LSANLKRYFYYFCLFFLSFAGQAEFGISADKITIGMSNPQSGPSANLGQQFKLGAVTHFNAVNLQGGINGKKIELLSLDDGYEPLQTVENTRSFLLTKSVFALFGYVGTPTSHSILPLLESSQIPYLMPMTGASFLRTPDKKNVYNLRASYHQEIQYQVNYLLNQLKLKNIGLLIQADEFGLSVENEINEALSMLGSQPIVITRFKRNTTDIDAALTTLIQHNVNAIVLVGTTEPLSEFINASYERDFKPVFTTVSFASSDELFKKLKYSSHVLVTEVVPNPKSCTMKICKSFRAQMKKAKAEELNHINFEGYLSAMLFVEAAKKCGEELTQQCLLTMLKTQTFTLDDLIIEFNPQTSQGLNQVFASINN